MKKFLKNILLFTLLIAIIKVVIIASTLINLPKVGYGYFLGHNEKKNKIVIVGSSNVEHNFDYDLLSKTFVDRSFIGVSLNAPTGLYGLLYKLKRLGLKQNDIVIMALPYSLYNEDKFLPITSSSKYLSLKVIKSSFIDFPGKTARNLLNIKFSNLKSSLKTRNLTLSGDKFIQFKNSFFGYTKKTDSLYLSCFTNTQDKFFIDDTQGDIDKSHLLHLKDMFNQEGTPKYFFRFPVLPQNQFKLDSSKLLFLEKNLNFINTPSSAVLKKEFFYDQWYHLNFCGATQNTLDLIDEINLLIIKKKSELP
tara:strand:- start:399 stop:1319 length:921 start_codon:yes stop_codon:yes gene_type:complete